jgi:geranylgeranyl diphosphate/geranylgeranyl-bacteriochlorophyllide a reductase
MMSEPATFDVVVVGGGPAGATAACDLAQLGRSVLLVDRAGRIKPCGGAIPPKLIREFQIPDALLVARARAARIVSPSNHCVDMPINGGYVGMVDRDSFDEWLRERARNAGAVRRESTFKRLTRDLKGDPVVHLFARNGSGPDLSTQVRARAVIGADGALSAVARQCIADGARLPYVFAYHEIVRLPGGGSCTFDTTRCDVIYKGALSPDFYSWIFPHGAIASVGTGTAHKGVSLRAAVEKLRQATGLETVATIRREGAPIPLSPLARWDNGRDVLLAGDAAGVVAPASGEGIYYAMVGGRLAAQAVDSFLTTGDPRTLGSARRRFMTLHGRVFFILGLMQRFWYANDGRRERFVRLCADRDIQELTWDAYMNKQLVRARPAAHLRIAVKNFAHLTGLIAA